MKSTITNTALLALLTLGLASCNKDMDERFTPLPDQPHPDQPVNPDQWDYSRHVMLYDFTGQNCVNCPTGHEVMAQIQQVYGEAFIPVSIHAGGNTWSIDENVDKGGGYRGLRNDIGEAIASQFGVTQAGPFPCAIVDAHGALSTQTPEWLTLVTQAFQGTATVPVAMKMECALGDNSVTVKVDAKGTEAVKGQIHVWVLESGIKAYQKMPTGLQMDYEHNHVFRAAANGAAGYDMDVAADQVSHYDATVSVTPISGDMDNLTVLAFITDASGLVQAVEWNPGDEPQTQPLDYNRHVLLYDFTGQNCVNCPTGHEEMAKIQQVYGADFLPVSIHAGGNTWSIDENVDKGGGFRGLRNDTGEAIAAQFGVTQAGPFPCAIVDAHGTLSTQTSEWLTMVSNAFQQSATVSTGMAINCQTGDNEINVTVKAQSSQAIDGMIHVWVLESGIKAYQKLPTGVSMDYVHNHVFRAAAHGASGEAFNLAADQLVDYNATVSVTPLGGNMDALSVIAFITTPAGLVQAVEWSPEK